MTFFKLLFLAGLSTTLFISCGKTKRNPFFGDEDAQFYVGSVTGTIETTTPKNDQKIVTQKKLSFIACLKDLAGGPIPNRLSFQIQSGQETKVAETNKEGCISWAEVHSFEPIQNEKTLRLPRSIISKNEFNGKRNVTIYWNITSDKISNDLEPGDEPLGSEDPIENGFNMVDATATVQSQDPNYNSNFKTRLILTDIEFDRRGLSLESPFKVDQNLTLYAQHIYRIKADPKYYVNTQTNPDTEVTTPGGNYKITLVFMDDPRIDLEKMISELNGYSNLNSLNLSQTIEGNQLKPAAQVMLLQKEVSLNETLSSEKKNLLLNKFFIPSIHATAQFIADKKTGKTIDKYVDIAIKKLAKLDVRSIVAVTIQDISSGQKQYLKGHGVGYVKNLLELGNIPLMQIPIEADKLFAEYQRIETANKKETPLKLFIESQKNKDSKKDLAMMDKSDISNAVFPQSIIPNTYTFSKELEHFLDDKLSTYRKDLFLRSLCHKMFLNDDLKSIEGQRDFPDQVRLTWAFNCHSGGDNYLKIAVLDFVENADDSSVIKIGKSDLEEIEFSSSLNTNAETERPKLILNLGTIASTLLDIFAPGLFGDISSDLFDWWLSSNNKTTMKPKIKVAKVLDLANKTELLTAPLLKFGIGQAFYYLDGFDSKTTNQTSISRRKSKQLNVDIDNLKIGITTRRCLIVYYTDAVVNVMAEKSGLSLRQGAIACSEKAKKRNYEESYFKITQDCTEKGGTTDCASDAETNLRTIIRGKGAYHAFNQIVGDKDLQLSLRRIDDVSLAQKRMRWTTILNSAETNQIFPGTFIDPKMAQIKFKAATEKPSPK